MRKLFLALPCLLALAACGSDSSEACLGSTKCGDTCVDTAHDQLNCGACGNACDAHQSCTDGACVDTGCLPGSAQCGATCVMLASDSQNCGACGNACAAGQVCSSGACATTCAVTTSPCGGACVDLTSDNANCGGCGVACVAGQACIASACVLEDWQELSDLPGTIRNVSRSVPDGEVSFYFNMGSSFWRLDPPDTLVPLADLPFSVDDYLTLARVGGTLYLIDDVKMYAYSIATNTWTTPIEDLVVVTAEAQTAADDNGFIYSVGNNMDAGKYQLIKVDSSDMSIDYFDLPTNLGDSETRVVWDHASARVYLADYEDEVEPYAFDPATSQFSAALKPISDAFADADGFSDATCGDNRGHLFAGTGTGTDKGIYVYTAGADTWARLPDMPFTIGNNASCVVAGGWLYVTNANSDPTHFARYPIGN